MTFVECVLIFFLKVLTYLYILNSNIKCYEETFPLIFQQITSLNVPRHPSNKGSQNKTHSQPSKAPTGPESRFTGGTTRRATTSRSSLGLGELYGRPRLGSSEKRISD
jgi:hypothetical protein